MSQENLNNPELVTKILIGALEYWEEATGKDQREAYLSMIWSAAVDHVRAQEIPGGISGRADVFGAIDRTVVTRASSLLCELGLDLSGLDEAH